MSDKNNGFISNERKNGIFIDFICHFCIQRWKRIIKHINVGIAIQHPRQGQSHLLSAWQTDPTLSNHSVVSIAEQLQILLQTCFLNHRLIPIFVERPSK